jgi:hypothetical protein
LENGRPIPVFLLINKVDLLEDKENWEGRSEIEQFCKEQGFDRWFLTSAKEDIGVCYWNLDVN